MSMDIWFKAKVDWGEALGLLSDTEAGRFAKALWRYAATGEAERLNGREQMLFALVLADLRREAEARRRLSAVRSEAGRRGGRPRGESNESFCFSEKATQSHKESIEREREITIQNAEKGCAQGGGAACTPAVRRAGRGRWRRGEGPGPRAGGWRRGGRGCERRRVGRGRWRPAGLRAAVAWLVGAAGCGGAGGWRWLVGGCGFRRGYGRRRLLVAAAWLAAVGRRAGFACRSTTGRSGAWARRRCVSGRRCTRPWTCLRRSGACGAGCWPIGRAERTARGIERFVVAWLSREQDRARASPAARVSEQRYGQREYGPDEFGELSPEQLEMLGGDRL